MQGMEILNILNLILEASIILLFLLIFVIGGIVTYYFKVREVGLDNLKMKAYRRVSNK
ncbi:hypothetical protein LGL08_22870 [Clostridium estertheticum]|uniref:hypothetical protein n=1 Tax=Clostridium estertheticum TaxID=238834 RepID=UPI001CF292F1|nr:hypothetical protein [Clostridium estertheticum]MCB2309378.1 hypothetical protein [Clostridium estertheticum]MCB2347825.1 hypothetical protein [Clostridium estertheticum]MCB2352356.1 hypothetical protein [Clostridium estertheticum]WAG48328.1 hypothetical protein LL127_22785 [Clostridium estertheticum]